MTPTNMLELEREIFALPYGPTMLDDIRVVKTYQDGTICVHVNCLSEWRGFEAKTIREAAAFVLGFREGRKS